MDSKPLIWYQREIYKGENADPILLNFVEWSSPEKIKEVYRDETNEILNSQDFKFMWLVSNCLMWIFLRSVDISEYGNFFLKEYYFNVNCILDYFEHSNMEVGYENLMKVFFDIHMNQILLLRNTSKPLRDPAYREIMWKSYQDLISYDFSSLNLLGIFKVISYMTVEFAESIEYSTKEFADLRDRLEFLSDKLSGEYFKFQIMSSLKLSDK
tara:strand:+ start:1589 stop:2224 length:636 start_codon:yes stop_codon:yes gene_type:complete